MMKALLTILALLVASAAHADTVTTLPPGARITIDCQSAGTPPAPTPTPTPAPPPVTVPPGVTLFAVGQRDDLAPNSFQYSFMHNGMSLDSSVAPNATKAYAFVNEHDPLKKRAGRIVLEDGNRGSGLKDMSISETPGAFDGLPAPNAIRGVLAGGIYWTADGSKYAGLFSAAKLVPGKTYYLNIRSAVPGAYAGFLLMPN